MSDLLSQTAWRRWTVASLLSRLPISMGLLAFVLAGQQSLDSAAQGSVLAGLLGLSPDFWDRGRGDGWTAPRSGVRYSAGCSVRPS